MFYTSVSSQFYGGQTSGPNHHWASVTHVVSDAGTGPVEFPMTGLVADRASLSVYLNGVLLDPGTAFSVADSGSQSVIRVPRDGLHPGDTLMAKALLR